MVQTLWSIFIDNWALALPCQVNATYVSHDIRKKPNGQAVRSITCHTREMCWKTSQTPSEARAPGVFSHNNNIIFICWQYFKLLFTVLRKAPNNYFLSYIVPPHSVDMHFNKVTHRANEYLQLLEMKCTQGFVVRLHAVIRENSCWNSSRSLKATN